METIGVKLKAIRKKHKMNQIEFSESGEISSLVFIKEAKRIAGYDKVIPVLKPRNRRRTIVE
jgi:hypothetical protein